MTIQLIISDIDGCISPEESQAWDREAFNRFVHYCHDAAAGKNRLAPLTLCTGRPQPYVEVLMKILDIRFPAICEAGAVFYTLSDNYARFNPTITPERIRALHQLRERIIAEVLPKFPGLIYQFGKEAQLSFYSETTSFFNQVITLIFEIANTIPGLDISITPSKYYLNIDLKGVSKGSAIRSLMDQLGLSKNNVAGIGDTMGDISIRDAVSFFACPANAVPEIKAVADYVSPFPDIYGVLDILERKELQRDRI